jgi:hypothetical protein
VVSLGEVVAACLGLEEPSLSVQPGSTEMVPVRAATAMTKATVMALGVCLWLRAVLVQGRWSGRLLRV